MKIKLLGDSVNVKNVVITFIEAARLKYFPKDALMDLIPSALVVLVYNDFKSRETRYELFGTKSI